MGYDAGDGFVAGDDELTEALVDRWQEADAAVEALVAVLVAAATGTADRTVHKGHEGHKGHSGHSGPDDRARSKRRPKGTRGEIAEVIRSHRLAPGLTVDRNMIAALLIGHRDLVTNPVLVVAVAKACGIISGHKLSAKKADRMWAASVHVADLIAKAETPTTIPLVRVEQSGPPELPAVEAPVQLPTPGRRWWILVAAALLMALLGLAVLLTW